MTKAQIEKEPLPTPGGRLLILNIGRIGDTILRNSILAPAYRTYAAVDYICGRHNAEIVRAELLRQDSRLQRVTVLRNTPAGFAGLLKISLRQRYDGLIDLKRHPSSTSLIMAMLFRSRVKTGCNRGLLRPFHRDVRKVNALGLHVLETMRRIGELAGLAMNDYRPTILLPPDSIEWFQKNYVAYDRPFIFLNLSATNPNRVWPVKNWVQYVRSCGLAGKAILINGSPQDRERVHELCRELPGTEAFQPRCFMDVAAAINAARLVLTVETGVVHACSAFDKPIIAFYCEHETATAYEPLSTWRLVIRPQTGHTVLDIRPEHAIAETRQRNLPALF